MQEHDKAFKASRANAWIFPFPKEVSRQELCPWDGPQRIFLAINFAVLTSAACFPRFRQKNRCTHMVCSKMTWERKSAFGNGCHPSPKWPLPRGRRNLGLAHLPSRLLIPFSGWEAQALLPPRQARGSAFQAQAPLFPFILLSCGCLLAPLFFLDMLASWPSWYFRGAKEGSPP